MWYANRIANLLLALLLLCACQPVTRPPVPEAQPAQGLRPDAPSFAVHGPYAVGMREFSAPAGDKTVDLSVWYPALNPENVPESITYQIGANVPDVAGLPITGRAIADAAPATEQGPYPLVVFSPGLAGWKQANSYLLEHLASYGFVVIASDPRGETFTEFWEGAATRPVDTQAVIDFADKSTAAGGELAGLIDTDHIAVAGHSSGGWAALAGGGAQMDFGWCAANPAVVAENELSNCTQFVPHADDIAAIRGLPSTPSELWPPTNDPRVAAVVALAPDGDIWGADYQGVAAVKVPTLVMAGTADTVNIPERCAYPVYEHLGSAKKTLITFAGGDHMIFFNQCRDTTWMLPDMFWACSDAVWDMDRAHDLVNHFVTAFLQSELKGDPAAATALAPENVSYPGIHYERAGYDNTAAALAPLDAATTAKIDAIVQQAMTDSPIPGFQMCVVKDGQVVYNKAFGMADAGEARPMSTQSAMVQGSITKMLTALAVMRLAEQGKIDLDAPVTDYLPYFTMADKRYKDITVRMLLSHHSGLPDSPQYWPEPLDPTLDPLEQAVRDLADMRLLFGPDSSWSYSSYGYSALGAIIAAVTGKPYATYMQEELLGPLGMTDSTFVPAGVAPDLRTTLYASDEQGRAVATPLQCDERDTPACMLTSSCEDMAKLARLLLNKGELNGVRLLQPESLAAMWAPLAFTGWREAFGARYGTPLEQYGLGSFVGDMGGHRVIGHPGAGDGINTDFLLAPDDGLAVIAMDNWFDFESNTGFPAWNAATDALYVMLGIDPQ